MAETGWDPEVKTFFRKIIRSFALAITWLLACMTLGLYFRLALFRDAVQWYNLVFYVLFLASLALLLRFYYRTWKNYRFQDS